MIVIAHRALLDGPNKALENHPKQIRYCLAEGIPCEIDVWWYHDRWWLGHDKPEYETTIEFLSQDGLWIHCKNLDALNLLREEGLHCFWHQEDDATLTSWGYIWTYPMIRHLYPKSIAVLPEIGEGYWDYVKTIPITGVCTDFVNKWNSESYK